MVVKNEDRPVHDVHLLGCMAGCERRISCDHHQLMTGILQRAVSLASLISVPHHPLHRTQTVRLQILCMCPCATVKSGHLHVGCLSASFALRPRPVVQARIGTLKHAKVHHSEICIIWYIHGKRMAERREDDTLSMRRAGSLSSFSGQWNTAKPPNVRPHSMFSRLRAAI